MNDAHAIYTVHLKKKTHTRNDRGGNDQDMIPGQHGELLEGTHMHASTLTSHLIFLHDLAFLHTGAGEARRLIQLQFPSFSIASHVLLRMGGISIFFATLQKFGGGCTCSLHCRSRVRISRFNSMMYCTAM